MHFKLTTTVNSNSEISILVYILLAMVYTSLFKLN